MSAGPAVAAAASSAGKDLALKAGVGLIVAWILVALFAPWIAPYDPIAQNLPSALRAPSLAHPFGTDNFGRDVLSRVIWGARIDLAMGVIGILAPVLIGCGIGLVAGYFGGIVDTLLMRVLDITISFPFFVLMIAIISVLGPGLTSFFIALALVGWVSYARLVRSRTLALRHSDFVVAGQILGFSSFRIMLRMCCPTPFCRRWSSPCRTSC